MKTKSKTGRRPVLKLHSVKEVAAAKLAFNETTGPLLDALKQGDSEEIKAAMKNLQSAFARYRAML